MSDDEVEELLDIAHRNERGSDRSKRPSRPSAGQRGFVGPAGPGDALRTKYTALSAELERNAFQRPLVIRSSQSSGTLRGDVYAVVDHSFGTVDKALRAADPAAKALIISGNSQKKVVEMVLAAGAKGFLEKPYSSEELSAAVTKAAS